MGKYDKLLIENEAQKIIENKQFDVACSGMKEMADDSRKTVDLYNNPETVLNEIDEKFKEATKLDNADIAFLFFATALQCVRQYFITNWKERESDQKAARNTKGHNEEHSARKRGEWFLPSPAEIVANPVPYDAIRQTKLAKSKEALIGAGDLRHRLVLGHDPILGWIFGVSNIATSTITNWKLQSFHVKSMPHKQGSTAKVDRISTPVQTSEMIKVAGNRFFKSGIEGYTVLVTSLIKEWVHLKSDINTKDSLPFPIISVFSTDLVNKFAKYGLDMGNITAVSKQAMYAEAINVIIGILHGMYCYYSQQNTGEAQPSLKEISYITRNKDCQDVLELNKVKTRKILLFSNLIATCSNIIAVSIMEKVEKGKGLSYLDVGGIVVTLHRLISDTKFISEVKKEFLEKEWYNAVVGEEYKFIAEAEKMSKKDILKGIEIQAKSDAAKAEKVADGLAVHAGVLNEIKSTQQTVHNKVDVVLQDKCDQEAEILYGLKSNKKVSDLDYTEQRVLSAVIYTLLANGENNSDLQRRFYQCVEQYGVSERFDDFDFSNLKNIDSYSDRRVILKAVCAFLFLKDFTFDFKEDTRNYGWLADFTSCKDVEEVCGEIEKEYFILGADGVVTGYLVPTKQIETTVENEQLLEETTTVCDDNKNDYSELHGIIEKYLADEKALGKKTEVNESLLKRELGKDYPNVSLSAVIAATKISNGYLFFTTYAVYLKEGSIIRGKYICLPYDKIIVDGISTADGLMKGTRKLNIPYLNDSNEQSRVELDDFKVTEEKLRELLIEIKNSGCAVSDTDKNVEFKDLNEQTKELFFSILCNVLNKEKHSLMEIYLLISEYNVLNRWNDIAEFDCDSNTEALIKDFVSQIPYLSENSVSTEAMKLFMRTVARSNLLDGKEATLLTQYEEKCIKCFDVAGKFSDTDFNIMLKQCSKNERNLSLEELAELKDSISVNNILYSDKILFGIEKMIDNIEKAEEAKQNTPMAKLAKTTQDKVIPLVKGFVEKTGEQIKKIDISSKSEKNDNQ